MVQMIRLKSHEEWLKHRERIGGSDAAAIVGMNPYKSNVELWQIKTGQVVPEDISNPLRCTPGRVTETLTFAAAWPVLPRSVQAESQV